MQFLYYDGEFLQFMDSATYEQIALTHDQVGEAADWIIDGMNVDMLSTMANLSALKHHNLLS